MTVLKTIAGETIRQLEVSASQCKHRSLLLKILLWLDVGKLQEELLVEEVKVRKNHLASVLQNGRWLINYNHLLVGLL